MTSTLIAHSLVFPFELMGCVLYATATCLLLAKNKLVAALFYRAVPATRLLTLSFAVLAIWYMARVILTFYIRNRGLGDVPAAYYYQLALANMPILCVMAAPLKDCLKMGEQGVIAAVLGVIIPIFLLLWQAVVPTPLWVQKAVTYLCMALCAAVWLGQAFLYYKLVHVQVAEKRMYRKQGRLFRLLFLFTWNAMMMAFAGVAFSFFVPLFVYLPLSFLVHAGVLIPVVFNQALQASRSTARKAVHSKSPSWVLLERAENDMYNKYEAILARLKTYMETSKAFTDPDISRHTVADAIGTNVTYLSRVIASCSGMSFRQFVNLYRIRYAKTLFLENPEKRMLDLCVESGFRSFTTFSMTFKLQEGVSPGEWCRSNHQSKQGGKPKTPV